MKADTITKDYVKDAGVFADIFNYYIYGGRQVILPEQLMERDSTKEVVNVCQAIQEMRKDSEKKKAQEVAGNLYRMGLDIEKIAQAVGYAVETVKGWLGIEGGTS